MSLDLKTLQMGLEKLTTLRPIPKALYVENYIKAYFLPEIEVLPWCKEHPEYTLKQWQSIVHLGVGNQMKKTSRQALLNALEEQDKFLQQQQQRK